MEITELITPESVVPNLRVANKRQLLQELAKRAAPLVGSTRSPCSTRWRSASGSAAPGSAAARRCRTAGSPSCTRMFGLFARLEKPIPFEAVDDQPVDLVFLLLTPETARAPII